MIYSLKSSVRQKASRCSRGLLSDENIRPIRTGARSWRVDGRDWEHVYAIDSYSIFRTGEDRQETRLAHDEAFEIVQTDHAVPILYGAKMRRSVDLKRLPCPTVEVAAESPGAIRLSWVTRLRDLRV